MNRAHKTSGQFYKRALFLMIGCVSIISAAPASHAEDALPKSLLEKGVAVASVNGGGVAVTIKDCSRLEASDYQIVVKLPRVKSLSVGLGFNDASLALLAELTELESFTSNGMQLTDDGMKPFSKMKKLKSVAFFHPGAAFSGAGLIHFADLPDLERLTVAGSEKFGDVGMKAVGKLTQLKEFRTWHSGVTIEGLPALKTLTALKSLHLGQRLSYKPPVSVSNEAIPILVELKSLESIQLSEARISRAALVQLKQLPALKKLTLDGIELPKADLELLTKEFSGVSIKYTEPSETYLKRIHQLFGNE